VVVFRRLILIAGLILAAPATSVAQARLTGADLAGTVTDQTGSFVPGCTITVTNLDTNVSRTVTTDARGDYSVPALPLATYTITATLAGFKTQTREGVDVLLGQAIRVDFTLVVGAESETVTVDAIAPIVSPTRTEISAVINQHQIDSLPINVRNFIGFALITPGVNADRTVVIRDLRNWQLFYGEAQSIYSIRLHGVQRETRFWVGLATPDALTVEPQRGLNAVAETSVRALTAEITADESVLRLERLELAAALLPPLLRVLDVREVFDHLSKIARAALPHDMLTLGLFDENDTTLTMFARTGTRSDLGRTFPQP
jgi:hypothetical protein